jgi:glycosyltransferase involved in cell wall biosynthesis
MDTHRIPEYSIIICTYNRERFVGDTLNSVAAMDFDSDRLELLLIDNNSTDRTREICTEFKRQHIGYPFRYIQETQQGLSFARNRGIREAKGSVLIFLDDDIYADQDYLNHVDAHFKQYPTTAAAGTRVDVHYENKEPEWMSHFLRPMLGEQNWGVTVKEYRPGRYPFGCSMAIRADVIRKTGGFDTRIGRKGKALGANEEKDLFDRIRHKGYIIRYIPHAVLRHRIDDARLTEDYVCKQAIGIGFGDYIRFKDASFTQKSGRYFKELIKVGGTVVLSIYHILRFEPAKSKMLLKFRWWVISGLLGIKKP